MGKKGQRLLLRQGRIAAARKKRRIREPVHLKYLAAMALVLAIILPFRLVPGYLAALSNQPLQNASDSKEGPSVIARWEQTPLPTASPEPAQTPEPQAVSATGIEILIYHTHATEAYSQIEGSEYEESGEWRTEDEAHNVIAVGSLLAEELIRQGFTVYHDKTNYESPKLSTAYSRSLIGMEAYSKKHPNLRYFIDLHRDAYGSGESGQKDYVLIDGKPCARMMFVVGTGEGAVGGGFGKMPDYEENLSFAQEITAELRSINELFMRDVRVKTGRYNQHMSDRCLLLEAGHNQNTLEQVKNSIPYLARAIAGAIKKDVG